MQRPIVVALEEENPLQRKINVRNNRCIPKAWIIAILAFLCTGIIIPTVLRSRKNETLFSAKSKAAQIVTWASFSSNIVKETDTLLAKYVLTDIGGIGTVFVCIQPCDEESEWRVVLTDTGYMNIYTDDTGVDSIFHFKWNADYRYVGSWSASDIVSALDGNFDDLQFKRFGHSLTTLNDPAMVIKGYTPVAKYAISYNLKQVGICPGSICDGVFYLLLDGYSGLEVNPESNQDKFVVKNEFKLYSGVLTRNTLVPALENRKSFQGSLSPLDAPTYTSSDLAEITKQSTTSSYAKYVLSMSGDVYACVLPFNGIYYKLLTSVDNLVVYSVGSQFVASHEHIFISTGGIWKHKETAPDKFPTNFAYPDRFQSQFVNLSYLHLLTSLSISKTIETPLGKYYIGSNNNVYMCTFLCSTGHVFEVIQNSQEFYLINQNAKEDTILYLKNAVWKYWTLTPVSVINTYLTQTDTFHFELDSAIKKSDLLPTSGKSVTGVQGDYVMSTVASANGGNMYLCPKSYAVGWCFLWDDYAFIQDFFIVTNSPKGDYFLYRYLHNYDNSDHWTAAVLLTASKTVSWIIKNTIQETFLKDYAVQEQGFLETVVTQQLTTSNARYILASNKRLYACSVLILPNNCNLFVMIAEGVNSFSLSTTRAADTLIYNTVLGTQVTIQMSSPASYMAQVYNPPLYQ